MMQQAAGSPSEKLPLKNLPDADMIRMVIEKGDRSKWKGRKKGALARLLASYDNGAGERRIWGTTGPLRDNGDPQRTGEMGT